MMKRSIYARVMAVAVLCGAVGSAACGDSKTPSDAGPVADMDGVDGNIDAGEEPDANLVDLGSEPDDAGPDAAAPTDVDDDGVPGAMDCDDADAAIGRSATEACSSACAAGVRTCADGIWAECDALTDCTCPTVGATRTAACGNCGLLSQRCSDVRVWEDVSPCLGEGECAPAAFERDTSRCGDRVRICDDACAWRPWTVTTPQGECEAPESRPAVGLTCGIAEVPVSDCTPTCTWVDSCRSGCDAPAAASRTGAVPICIPRGPFILGTADLLTTTTRPVTTVTLSSFYIDRDMVTAGRYRACIAAGTCVAPAPDASFGGLVDGAIAVQLRYEDADAFCAWDGGRLPTEYQWEKAARGPAPAASLGSYSGLRDCDQTDFCGGRVVLTPSSGVTTNPAIELLISALPRAYSPWGVHQLGPAVWEYTSTLYASDHAGVALMDPGDRAGSGPAHTLRGDGVVYATREFAGTWRVDSAGAPFNAVTRRPDTGRDSQMFGFRCVY